MRIGKFEPTHYNWLKDNCNTFKESTNDFINARIRDQTIDEYSILMPNRCACYEINLDILKSHNRFLLAIPSIVKGAAQYNPNDCPNILYFTKDCRVKYTNNFNTDIGVTNGTQGTLKYVVYDEDEDATVLETVKYLLVKFDEELKGLP